MKQEDYVDKAERVMKEIAQNDVISTSKIRDLLAQVNELYNDIVHLQGETLGDNYVEKIRHLKVKMIYDAGRDRLAMKKGEERRYPEGKVKYFYDQSGLLDMVSEIGNSKKKFLEYCRYFEALVAYHKFFGGN